MRARTQALDDDSSAIAEQKAAPLHLLDQKGFAHRKIVRKTKDNVIRVYGQSPSCRRQLFAASHYKIKRGKSSSCHIKADVESRREGRCVEIGLSPTVIGQPVADVRPPCFRRPPTPAPSVGRFQNHDWLLVPTFFSRTTVGTVVVIAHHTLSVIIMEIVI